MYFDLMAKDFDTDDRIERAKVISDEIRSHIVDGHNKTALEYACGTGLVGFQLINTFNTLLFVDCSAGMIEQVKQKLTRLGRATDSAVCGDFVAAAPNDLKVDYIFSSLALHHIKDTETIVSRLYDVLNDGGRLIIADLNTDNGDFHAEYPDYDGHNGFDRHALAQLAENAGFANVETKTFYHSSKIVGGKTHPYSVFILVAAK